MPHPAGLHPSCLALRYVSWSRPWHRDGRGPPRAREGGQKMNRNVADNSGLLPRLPERCVSAIGYRLTDYLKFARYRLFWFGRLIPADTGFSWLFSDTADGAKASAVIYSLILTCRACGVASLIWLRHVLTRLLQRDDNGDIGDQLPINFKKTSPG